MPETLWAKDLPLDEQLHAFTVGNDRSIDLELLPFDAEGERGARADARRMRALAGSGSEGARRRAERPERTGGAPRAADHCRNRKMATPRSRRR